MTDPGTNPTPRSGNSRATISVPQPRQRVFLKQSVMERAAGIAWSVMRNTLFRWSPPSFRPFRNFLLRSFGARIGSNTFVSSTCRIDFPWNLELGSNVYICHETILNCMGRIRIGDRTRLSQYAHICAGTHDYGARDMRIIRCPIDIGNDVWIAADTFVGPNVKIGNGCMLAARSSAFSDLPEGMVCVGEPAEPRKSRDELVTATA